MNILIADDGATNIKLLRAVLEAEHMTVFDAANGVEALAVLEHEKVDAIISDILMREMDGYRLCHEVRADKRFRHLPFIIYTTTYTSASDEKLSLSLGADRFVRRPQSSAVLLEILRNTLTACRPAPAALELQQNLTLKKNYDERPVNNLEEKDSELEIARSGVAPVAGAHPSRDLSAKNR